VKNSPVAVEVLHTGRRADELTDTTELIVTFHNFANAPKNN